MPQRTRLSRPVPNGLAVKKYSGFRGVDFSKEPSMVDDSHSPMAKNLMTDSGGFLEKRLGWRILESFGAGINGIYRFDAPDEGEFLIVHAGTEIYKYANGTKTLLKSGVADNISTGKYFKGLLCILTGSEYLVYDGESCTPVSENEDVYASPSVISRESMHCGSTDVYSNQVIYMWKQNSVYEHYDGTPVDLGGAPEDVMINLISPRRENSFRMKNINGFQLFILDGTVKPGMRVTLKCTATGDELASVVFTPNSSGEDIISESAASSRGVNAEYFEISEETASHFRRIFTIGNSTKNNCGYVICGIKGSALPGYVRTPGIDDFAIEYAHEVEGYTDRINKCTVMDIFENRVFFSGNPDYPNADWYSGVNDPRFIPDINYTEIGVDASAITGYLRTGSEQAILKSEGEDSTVYMRSYEIDDSGKVIFPIRQGTSGIASVAPRAVCEFLDDPLFLSDNGVYAIAIQDISRERALQQRSSYINRKLCKSESLKDAVACVWRGNYVLVCGDEAYVADAANKTYVRNKTGTFEYEWQYWTNIPARTLMSFGGELFFGTESGKLCKFNSDMKEQNGEISCEAYSDNGDAIDAVWSTGLSCDGDFMHEKTLVKTGSGVFLKTYKKSGIKIYIRTDRDFGNIISEKDASVFDFSDIDFENFTFNTAPYIVVPFNTRIKKYGAIQIICRNDKKDSAFGICGIMRRYFTGNTRK